MKILVIDDSLFNLSAVSLSGLADHDVVTTDSVKEAASFLDKRDGTSVDFDIVLTDLWMPHEELGCYNRDYAVDLGVIGNNALIPAGLVFALSAATHGKKAAICTDANHHTDRLVELMDIIDRRPPLPRSVISVEARSSRARDENVRRLAWDAASHKIVAIEDFGMDMRPVVKDWGRVLRLLEDPYAK